MAVRIRSAAAGSTVLAALHPLLAAPLAPVATLAVEVLFWATSWIGIIVLVGLTYLCEILIDNTMARMTWRWMLGYAWTIGLAMSFVNLIWLHGR